MKKTMKQGIILCLCALLALCLCIPALALEQRVFDDAALFTPEEAQSLETRVAELRESLGVDLVVVTTDDAEGKSSMEYADDYFDYGGFGAGEDRDGALLLIDMDNRQAYISTRGSMIDYLTDQRIEEALDAVFEYLPNGEYAASMQAGLDKIQQFVQDGVPSDQYAYDQQTGEVYDPEVYGGVSEAERRGGISLGYVIFAVLCGVVVGGIVALCVRGSYKKKFKAVPYAFREQSKLTLEVNRSVLVNKAVTTRVIPKSPPPSSGDGGSAIHTSSSGSFHGGGGRSF